MPVVPTQKTRTVAPIADQGPFQTARGATVEAFGGSIGRATERLGGSIDVVAQELTNAQIERDTREAKELDVEYTRRRRELLYGNGTPENPGYFSTKGANTVEMSPVIQEQLEEIRQEVLGKASGSAVSRRFEEVSVPRREQALEQVTRYAVQQEQVAALATSQARIQEAIDDAVVGGITDDTILAQSLVVVRGEVLEQADQQGWPPEVIQSRLEEAQTALFQGMIIAAIRKGDVANAQRIFDENKSMIDGPIAAELQATLTTQTELANVQAASDEIMALSLPETEALAAARQITDANVRKGVVADIKRRYDEIKAAKKEQLGAISANAHQAMFSGMSLAEYAQNNPVEFSQLAGEGEIMRSLQNAEEATAERRTFSFVSDGTTLAGLLAMEDTELMNIDPTMHRHMLTESEFNKLVRAVEGAKGAVEGNTQETQAYFDGRRLLRELTPELEWNSSKQSKDQRASQNSLTSEMDAFVNGFVSQGKPPPTFEQMSAEARRLSQEAAVPGIFGFFFGGNEALISEIENMSPEQRSQVRVDMDDVPEELVNNVRKLFQEDLGRAPTDEEVEEYLGAYFLRDVARTRRLRGLDETGVPLGTQGNDVIEEDTSGINDILSSVFGSSAALAAGPAEAARGDATLALPPVNVGASMLIAEHEGKRNSVYLDSLGIPTIGIGFNLQRKDARAKLKSVGADIDAVIAGEEDLTDEQVSELFTQDVQQAERDARDLIEDFDGLSPNRQEAMIDMAFNLGKSKLAKFRRTLAAINRGNFQEAADQAQSSLWFKQVGRRGPRIVELIRNG